MIPKINKKAQLDETITWFVAFTLICFVIILFVGFIVSNAPTLLLNKNSIKVADSLQAEKDFDFNTQNAIAFLEFFKSNKNELSFWADDNHALTNPEVYQIMHNTLDDSNAIKAYEYYNLACESLKEFLVYNAGEKAEICIQYNNGELIENIFATKNSNNINCEIEAINCPRQKYPFRSFPIISEKGKQIGVFYNE